jgi:serine/threonine-protein kinase RsbW
MMIEAVRYSDAELKDLVEIRRHIKQTSLGLGGMDDPVAELVLAVNEAITNILIHGYRQMPGRLEIAVSKTGEDLVVIVHDESPPFDPNNIPPPDIRLPLERRRAGGMGIHMMRSFVDEMNYHPAHNGVNELEMVKRGAISPVQV